MQGKLGYRTAPLVDDLGDIKNILSSLEFTAIPFLWLDGFEKNPKFDNPKITDKLSDWMNKNEFKSSSGYFKELIYLLRPLGIVQDRQISASDLENPLGVDGPILSLLNPPRAAKVQELTVLGKELCDIVISGERQFVQNYSFWTFLTHEAYLQNTKLAPLIPIWRYVFSYISPKANPSVNDTLKRFTTDSYTINAFQKWSVFFNLCTAAKNSSGGTLCFDKHKMTLKFFRQL